MTNGKKVSALLRQLPNWISSHQITSKLWSTWHSRVEEALDQTLANLGTDYLDCKCSSCGLLLWANDMFEPRKREMLTWVCFIVYLIHWPVPLNPKGNHPAFPLLPDGKRDVDHSWHLKDTWKQMEAVLKKGHSRFTLGSVTIWYWYCRLGKVKSIGVSNFSKMKLEEILPSAEIVPAVDQVSQLRINVTQYWSSMDGPYSWNSTYTTRSTNLWNTWSPKESHRKPTHPSDPPNLLY